MPALDNEHVLIILDFLTLPLTNAPINIFLSNFASVDPAIKLEEVTLPVFQSLPGATSLNNLWDLTVISAGFGQTVSYSAQITH